MNNVYVVMSSEKMDNNEWFDEPCRAFESSDEADQFMLILRNQYQDSKQYENVTRFYVMRVPFGDVWSGYE